MFHAVANYIGALKHKMSNKIYILILFGLTSINIFGQNNTDFAKNISIDYFFGNWELYVCETDVCEDENDLIKFMDVLKIDSTSFYKTDYGWYFSWAFKVPVQVYDYDDDEYEWRTRSEEVGILINSISCSSKDTLKCEGKFYNLDLDECYGLILIEEERYYSYSIQDSLNLQLDS